MKKYTVTKNLVSAITIFSMVGMGASLTLAATPSPATQAARLAAIQTKGDTDIAARITSLNNLIAKINATTKLSVVQKSTLTTEIQGEVSGLSTLKAKLDTDTDVAMARIDFDNIFKQHYIYAFYLPRTERIIAADAESDAVSTMNTLVTSLQGYILQAKNSGGDVANMQSKLSDMQAKTADANTQSQGALNMLLPLTAAGYPGNKASVQGASTNIKTARADLEGARSDAKSIVATLKKMLSLK